MDPDNELQDFFATEIGNDAKQELANAIREDRNARDEVSVSDSELTHPAPHPEPKRRKRLDPSNITTELKTSDLGITGIEKTVRAGVICLHCGGSVFKGDLRFEYTFKINKAPRSIHTHCLAQIDAEAAEGSLKFLRGALQNEHLDREKKEACLNAKTILELTV